MPASSVSTLVWKNRKLEPATIIVQKQLTKPDALLEATHNNKKYTNWLMTINMDYVVILEQMILENG
jgi:hypothetical protein